MKFEPNREDTQYVLSLSYGKSSLACIGACEKLGWRIDRIIHAEALATDAIPADLPPMVEFKKKADKIIKDRWGIEVEHHCATKVKKVESDKVTYEKLFYHVLDGESHYEGSMKGFPLQRHPWCNDLKTYAVKQVEKMVNSSTNTVSFVGIAYDAPARLARIDWIKKISPLAAVGWREEDAMKWCITNDLCSPIYDDSSLGRCWFCHHQGVDQLRKLRESYPDLWKLLLKWDSDSPVTFHADGHTVHDFDKRFEMENKGLVPRDRKFRWEMICLQKNVIDT